MEKVSIKIAEYLKKQACFLDDEYEIYQYGIQIGLEVGISAIASLIIMLWSGMLNEGLLFFLVFIPLRSFLGGFHMKRYWKCFILSNITLALVLFIAKFVCVSTNISWLLLGCSEVYIGYVSYKGAGKGREDLYYNKKVALILLIVTLFAAIFTIVGLKKYLFIITMTVSIIGIAKIWGVSKRL